MGWWWVGDGRGLGLGVGVGGGRGSRRRTDSRPGPGSISAAMPGSGGAQESSTCRWDRRLGLQAGSITGALAAVKGHAAGKWGASAARRSACRICPSLAASTDAAPTRPSCLPARRKPASECRNWAGRGLCWQDTGFMHNWCRWVGSIRGLQGYMRPCCLHSPVRARVRILRAARRARLCPAGDSGCWRKPMGVCSFAPTACRRETCGLCRLPAGRRQVAWNKSVGAGQGARQRQLGGRKEQLPHWTERLRTAEVHRMHADVDGAANEAADGGGAASASGVGILVHGSGSSHGGRAVLGFGRRADSGLLYAAVTGWALALGLLGGWALRGLLRHRQHAGAGSMSRLPVGRLGRPRASASLPG